MKNYITSTDYEALWNLVQEGKEIICIDGEGYLGRTHITEDGETCIRDQDGFRLVGDTECKSIFISECDFNKIEFLPPNEWIKIESDKDLPPDGQSVECVFRGKEVSHASWDKCLNKWDNGDYYWAKEDITHYRPMPEAPKE